MYYGFEGDLTGEKELGQLFYYRDSNSKHNFFFAAAKINFKIKQPPERIMDGFISKIYGMVTTSSSDFSSQLSRINGMDAFLRLNFYKQFQMAGFLKWTASGSSEPLKQHQTLPSEPANEEDDFIDNKGIALPASPSVNM